jgi:DNA-binding LytR/AlgR family response regulator
VDPREMSITLNPFEDLENIFGQIRLPDFADLLSKLAAHMGKKSFLVFKHNKYINVPTENIALFYLKYETAMIMCFDGQEYAVRYSLEQVQSLLAERQFFRLNRQYLISFSAIKEVEHYFARKLLVHPVINTKDKLLVSKEKVTSFLRWLDNR